MKTSDLPAGVVSVTASSAGFAVAPQLKVSKRITIAAPVSTVWATLGDFGAISVWLAAVARVTLTRGTDNTPGAVRHLEVKGGGYVNEELLQYHAGQHCYQYRILDSVLPLRDYRSELKAEATATERTRVTWSSTFRRKDPGPTPSADANDAIALETITGLYEAGLANLKKVVEQK